MSKDESAISISRVPQELNGHFVIHQHQIILCK